MEKSRLKICMVLTNSINHDTRVLNEANTLGQFYDVTILTPQEEKLEVQECNFSVKQVRYRKFKSFILTMISMILSIIKRSWQENPDVFHAHDLDGLYVAFLPALFKRKLLVYDSHELWADLPPFSEIARWKWLLPILERLVIWRVNGGITINQSIAELLKKKYHRNFIVSRNLLSLDENHIVKKTNFDFGLVKDKDFIIHLGSTGQWRGMDQIITAAKYLPDTVRIVFLGANKSIEKFKLLAKKLGVEEKIIFCPPVPPEQILAVARRAKLGLTLTQNSSLDYYYSTPNKLFQYVAAEIPILGSNFPEFERVIIGEKIGEVVDPTKSRQIAKKIIDMLQVNNQRKYRKNLKGLARKSYNWEVESQNIVNFYTNLLSRKPRILIDINHPAHVHFFKNFYWDLKKRNYEVLVTASNKEMAQQLLANYKIDFVNMGSYGLTIKDKIIRIPFKFIRMYQVCRKFKPDILFGVASSRAAQAAFLIRKPCFLFDDTAYRFNVWLYLPFVSRVYTPDCFKINLGKKQVRYPGYHQLTSLHPARFQPDYKIVEKLIPEKRFFIIRFVSWRAGHDVFSHGFTTEGKIKLIKELSKFGQPIITSEAPLPKELERYKMKILPENIHHLIYHADLVISEGGTMASEAAILGTPSVFVSNLPADTLIEQSKKHHLILLYSDEAKALKEIPTLLKTKNLKSIWRKRQGRMLKDKIDVTSLLLDLVEKNEKA